MSRSRTARTPDRHQPDPLPNETSDDSAGGAVACQTAEAIHLREQYRDAFEGMQQEQEAMRQTAEQAGAAMQVLNASGDSMRRLKRTSARAGSGVVSVVRRDASRN